MANANWEHAHVYMDDAGTVIASSDLSSQVVDLTAGGGSSAYAAGTDRLVARVTSMVVPHGVGQVAIDWTGSSKFQAGTAVAVVGDTIVFVEGGCYSVEIHIPGGVYDDTDPDVKPSVDARLGVALDGTEWSDGADAVQVGDIPSSLRCLGAKYIWCHNPGDSLQYVTLQVPGAVDGTVGNIFAQIVRLSDVVAGDEFA